MCSTNLQGFKALPLRFSADSTGYHELFIKEHTVRTYDTTTPPGRTLFVINVPPYASKDSLKRVFSVAGTVSGVKLQKSVSEASEESPSTSGFKIAYVVFNHHQGLTKALKLNNLNPLSTEKTPVLTGLRKWIHDYNSSVCDQEALHEQVTSFMRNYEKEEEEKKLRGKEEVDDEGWTVVSKKNRNPGLSRKESLENKLKQKNKLKSDKRELKNFYTFQQKEQKMKHLITLRKNFQENKDKVNAMKKLRNFKPY